MVPARQPRRRSAVVQRRPLPERCRRRDPRPGRSGRGVRRERARYELGEVEGVGLAVTDAAALPDGRTLFSAAAEDTPNAVDDGPVVATALVLVDDLDVLAVAPIPEVGGHVHKIEGLALREVRRNELHLFAVVDDDDPARRLPSSTYACRWPSWAGSSSPRRYG